jgi:leukotriene-A4 hydrolase
VFVVVTRATNPSRSHAHASHFWLNEGWTTYIERLLQELIHSPAHRGLSYVIGYKALVDALELFRPTPKYQRLVIGFDFGEDPDEAYSRVPYDKGANFILLLGTWDEHVKITWY